MMKLRLAPLEHLVDLRRIAALKGIREEGAALVIGAMTTQAELLASDLVAARGPLLQEAAALIADPQVRYLGTVGGNVEYGDPANDMPADRQSVVQGKRVSDRGDSGGRRTIQKQN